MANTNAIRAGRAFVELFADDSKLTRTLKLARKKLKVFGESIRNLGMKMVSISSAVIAPLAGSAKLFSSMGDQVAKMSKRTGLSVETLSELKFVASQTGTEFESLEMGFRRMQRSIYDAGRGLSTATDALSDLGLRFEDLDGLSPEQQFKLLAERIGALKDPTKRAAIALTLFGRTGTNLLPMFKLGADGIEELQNQARALGLTMSGKDAKAAEDFTDTLDKLWKVVKMATFNIGAALAPALGRIAETITKIAVRLNSWIKRNRQLIVNIAKIAAIIVATGGALIAFGTIISSMGTAIGGLIATITTVGTVFKGLISIIGLLVNPIGAVMAAIVALGGYLVYTSGIGTKALGWLGRKFAILKDDALTAYGAIADALVAGDISLAARILWLTLKMEWTKGVNFLEKTWLGFRNFFIRIGYDAFYGLLKLVENIWSGLEVGWIETTAFFSKCWQSFVNFFAKTWENIKASAKKAWAWIKSLFDDSLDLESENKLIEQEKQQAIAKLDKDKQARIARIEDQRDAKRKRQAELHKATLAELTRQHDEKYDALDKEYKSRIAENARELEEARKQWRQSVERARRKRKETDTNAPAGKDDFNMKLNDILKGLEGTLSDATAKIGIAGVFNVSAVWGLSGGSAIDRTAKATEQTAKNTKKMLSKMNDTAALTFS